MTKLLIIDDDAVLRSALMRALKRHHLVVYESADSQSAQEIMLQQKIDWALIDLKLADESGLELSGDLIDAYPDIKIVVMTGYASIATAISAIKLGAINYLIKPVSVHDIVAAFECPDDTFTAMELPPTALSPKRMEWEHIQRVLQEHDGNISQTAQALNMHRRTLQRKLKKKPVQE